MKQYNQDTSVNSNFEEEGLYFHTDAYFNRLTAINVISQKSFS